MNEPHDSDDFQKFLSLDEEKRERIINAAMKEFLVGYKKGSTDVIVREAGISKGLLFHYFGTKERLYRFIIEHAINVMQTEFLNLINVSQPDILESVWQMSLLKRDLSVRYPELFDFLAISFIDYKSRDNPWNENLKRLFDFRNKVMGDIYIKADKSLLRDDIDKQMAMNIINWAMTGYSQSKITDAQTDNFGAETRENYDAYLTEFQDILAILRKCFYK